MKRLGYIESKIDDELKSSKEIISRLNYTENKTDDQTRILREVLNRLNYIETKIDRMMGNTRKPQNHDLERNNNAQNSVEEEVVIEE